MNLDQWGVPPDENCRNAGTDDRRDWVIDGFPDMLTLNGNPPGTAPTYVCGDTGAGGSTQGNSIWGTLLDQRGEVKLFPVNDCQGQLDKTGSVSPCPSTPDKYDIIGFTSLLIVEVYNGNDPAATGTTGASGTCNGDYGDIQTGNTIDLVAFGIANGCFTAAPDAIAATSLTISPRHNPLPDYVLCGSAPCHYTYDGVSTVQWTATNTQVAGRNADRDDLQISFDWSNVGTVGACEPPERVPDPNAKCLVTEWRGFTTGPGPVGGGTQFGSSAVKLCDLEFAVGCPDQS
jgi:hypothetical protein